MKIHLVLAHPEPFSFNSALHQTAVDMLTQNKIGVSVSNLYYAGFNPVAGPLDMHGYPQEHFALAAAQRWASNNAAFSADIVEEQSKLVECDAVILQFPLWWWSFPAILKGWIDRVLSSGFAYGKENTLPAKKVMYSITTGGADSQEDLDYYQSKINALYEDVFGFLGWETLPPFIAHGVQRLTDEERQLLLGKYKAHLQQVFN
ncbi:NAD(P)H-dependent oxidoreductase [Pseudoalteromonas fenneropenaei]|uniref:NAD(P)H-dependent oxidoreductase n=1 Tax=Pseudoalteromonas fenneropenaei TaxID=1737459 RepID=A0ABV7CK10_9GAMM